MKRTEETTINNPLLNTITPIGLEFRRNNVVIGENLGRIYGVTKYPQEVEMGWLSKVSNMPGTIVSQTFTPVDAGELIEAISKNISQNRGIANSSRDPLTQQRAEKGAEDGERIMKEIDQDGETVGKMSVLVIPLSKEDDIFTKLCRRVEAGFAGIRCKIRGMANLQEQAFRTIAPYHVPDEIISSITERIVPLKSFIGGFPFAAQGYSDNAGYFFAKDSSDGLIVLDLWKRGGDRTNSNIVVMGVAGVGKSTTIKHIILSEYMKGTKIIIVDPEREYKELCENLKGDWINAGGSSGGLINPLEIRPAPRDEENEENPLYRDEGNGMGDMALHLKTLEIFFSLYMPSLTDIQKALLKETLEELYFSFNIRWDTDISKLKSTDFPTFKDLYTLIACKVSSNCLQSSVAEHYSQLACLLRDIALGSDRFLWNGHSNLQANSRCICLDTHDLQNTSDTIKKTQYFNLLTWCWEMMSRNRQEKVMLFCDEAYLLIDVHVPQSLVFLRNVSKRARKYEAGLAIISHSVVDFLDPSVKLYGQAMLDIPCYKVLMGTDGRNLKETAELYNLTDAEMELLGGKRRGEALLMVGSKRLHARFILPEFKLAYMGCAGGR